MTRKRIKPPKAEKSKIKKPTTTGESKIDYPIFCFKYLQLDFKGDYKFYYEFVERINKLSGLSWNQITTTQRHGFGTEKIPVKQIKPSLPKFISPDVSDLLVFKANGDKRPFLGLRKGNVFHIIFLEEKFGDVYNH